MVVGVESPELFEVDGNLAEDLDLPKMDSQAPGPSKDNSTGKRTRP